MTGAELYALTGIALFVIGLHGLIRYAHLMRKILALNVTGAGVFLVVAALAERGQDGTPDPVPQALVITGIVVAVAATGLALVLMLRVASATGRAELPDPRSE
ncbi:MAG: NADH-quinone oxidoreductase subunit K [Gammaproteobacteria bacterium]|nr:NADH-quinone oxidoreductase subunit K [Gammaproteobacteria bacterium]